MGQPQLCEALTALPELPPRLVALLAPGSPLMAMEAARLCGALSFRWAHGCMEGGGGPCVCVGASAWARLRLYSCYGCGWVLLARGDGEGVCAELPERL